MYLQNRGHFNADAEDAKNDTTVVPIEGAYPSQHNNPAVRFWLDDREDRKGFYLKNMNAAKEKVMTLLNYDRSGELLALSTLGMADVREVDEVRVQAWNVTKVAKYEDFKPDDEK